MTVIKWNTRWIIEKYVKQQNLLIHTETTTINGNIALNEGLEELIQLLIGAGGTPYDSTNAYIGIGDGTDAVDVTQTGLTGANKVYLPMDTGYPQASGTTVTWRATADETTANFHWNEFSLCNSNDESTGKNLNRTVADKGTKNTGEVWVITLEITFS